MSDTEANAGNFKVADDLRNLCNSPLKKHFPWNRLPRELRVKILQNPRRSDVDRIQLLNRETYELVRSNKRLLKRRLIERMLIQEKDLRLRLRLQCSEEGFSDERNLCEFQAICRRRSKGCWVSPFAFEDCLLKALKNSDIHCLEIVKVDALHLLIILFCFLNAGSRVHELTIKDARFTCVDASTFLRFLLDVASNNVHFLNVSDWGDLGPEVFQVLVSKQCFSLSRSYQVIPIDDIILAKLTATDFFIGAPNKITIGGLHSFVEDLISGNRSVVYGRIHTNFLLDGETFPTCPNNEIEVGMTTWDAPYIEFFGIKCEE